MYLRGVVEGLLYILRTACSGRLLPHDFPNRSTVQRYFYAWQTDGLWERINFEAQSSMSLQFLT